MPTKPDPPSTQIEPGAIGIDISPESKADVVWNLNQFPWPLPEAAFSRIYMSHIIEHLEDVIAAMREIHRLAQPGADLYIVTPHYSSHNSYTDPTHRRFFGYHSFDYLADAGDFNFYTPVRFRIVERQIRFYWINNTRRRVEGRLLTWLINRVPLLYERFLCWMLPANEVYFELEPAPLGAARDERRR